MGQHLQSIPQESQALQQLRKTHIAISQQAVNALQSAIFDHRFPMLEIQLKQGQFGRVLDAAPGSLDQQFEPGAIQTTYLILMREFGYHADFNDDGFLDKPEEAILIPCETIITLEKLWRKFTENRCGWYGSDSYFEQASCTELILTGQDQVIDWTTGETKITTTTFGGTLLNAIFPVPTDVIIERINDCEVVLPNIEE